MNSRYILRSALPASWPGRRWKDGFPSGNGLCGISVYGAVKREVILVNHGKLWHWEKRGQLPDVSQSLEQTREYLRRGEYRKADPCIAGALLDRGYESQMASPCPVGDILITMDGEGEFENYERSLNMESGEVCVRWDLAGTTYRRKTFVSRVRDVILLSLEASDPVLGAGISMQLHETGGEDTERMKKESEVSCYEKDAYLIYEVKNHQGEHFGIVGKILSCDGETEIIRGRIGVRNAGRLCVAFHIFGRIASIDTASASMDYLKSLKEDYGTLLSEHRVEHSRLFHSAQFRLEGKPERDYRRIEELLYETYRKGIQNELCELLWNYGRYLFISGTRPDSYPFQMYGLWGGEYQLVWSHYMANINIQMMYWHCISGGYADYLRAVIDYYTELIPDFQENAKKVFGLDGIYIPAGTTPGYGLMSQIVPVITNWIGAAGWISQHMYEYYLAQKDEEMLTRKIQPFMEQAALFYEQYLTEENGKILISPSVSPENTPGNLQEGTLRHMSHSCPTAQNATMDIAIIKELFTNLIALSEKRNCNTEKVPRWRKLLEGLPDYMVNQEGAVKEWAEENLQDFYYHRHLSHLYPVFPGKEFLGKKDFPLRKAFQKAVELRIQGGQSGWSLIQLAAVYARLEQGERALGSLENLARSCLTLSLFTLHNDWKDMGLTLDLYQSKVSDKAPVQMDASLGAVNVIQEMILQYSQDFIFLLPALPKKWKRGRASGFRFYNGSVDLEWEDEGKFFRCVIQSDYKQKLSVRFPGKASGKKVLVQQNHRRFTVSAEEMLKVMLEKGELLILKIK